MKINDSFLVAAAYFFGIPALYIVLTGLRKKEYVGWHGGQALVLWCFFFIIFFSQRFLVDSIWSSNYIPGLQWVETGTILVLGTYAVFCAYRSFIGIIFRIPR